MDIDKWLEKQMKKIQESNKDEMMECMEHYGLVDAVPSLYHIDEICEMTDEDLGAIFHRLRELSKNRVIVTGYSTPEYTGNYQTWEQMAALYTPEAGEEIGHVSGNSRKKVVVSNSGFPYPVPQKSKKRK